MTTQTTMMTYGGEGAELGQMTLERARALYCTARVDRDSGTITADDRSFAVRFANGRTVEASTYEEALAILDECEVIGHDGDLTDGGDRTLAWMTEADSTDDDGALAHASITRG